MINPKRNRLPKRRWMLLMAAGLWLGWLGAGCDDEPTNTTPAPEVSEPDEPTPEPAPEPTPEPQPAPGEPDVEPEPTPPEPDPEPDEPGPNPEDCDSLMPQVCAMPWPSNLYLQPDETRTTGYTLAFRPTSLPQNANDAFLNAEAWRRLDGYSIASPLLVFWDDLDDSLFATEDTMERSLEQDAQILWFEVEGDSLQRIPYWAELDPLETEQNRRTLQVRPTSNLKYNTRYIAAFRYLQSTNGNPIASSEAFEKHRDGERGDDPELAQRQAHFDEIFTLLESEGISRDELVLAWDFRTVSHEALHGQILPMRDAALEAVGEDGPVLVIDSIEEFAQTDDGSGLPVHPLRAVEIHGTFEVPLYLVEQDGPVGTGTVFDLDDKLEPQQNGTRQAEFWMLIPHSALTGDPHGMVLYGHGLLGRGSQVLSDFNAKIGNDHQVIFVGANWTGMSNSDVTNVAFIGTDIQYFPWLADRLHQGLTEFVLLARSMRQRLPGLSEITERGINLDPEQLYYSGISQGGIFGASFVALSPDITRGHLGVPGSNYNIMLQRSIDFGPYQLVVDLSYEDRQEQAILLALSQLLWDQTDPVSYYRHMSVDPFPGNEPSSVLLAAAKGDWQVPTLTNEIVARDNTDLKVMANYGKPLFRIEEQPYPYEGSGLVMYDFGNPWGPSSHIPPPEDEFGDPHGRPRRQDHHNAQMMHFLRTGEIIDVCGGDACTPE